MCARVGIVAGCSIAATLIRGFALDTFDLWVIPRSLSFDAYIEDAGLNSTGSIKTICRDLAIAAMQLQT
eukprot:9466078-Pyramimonas_sp.AAC.1